MLNYFFFFTIPYFFNKFLASTFIGSAWSSTTANEGFSIPDFIHYIFFPILILEKEPVFPFLMFSSKQGSYWYHFYNVFGMTRSLTGE